MCKHIAIFIAKNFTSAVFMPFHGRDAAVSQSCDGRRAIAVQPFHKCGTAEKKYILWRPTASLADKISNFAH